MLSTLDISWAAGFLEGEGCFFCGTRIHRNKNGKDYSHRYILIDATQKDIEPLLRLQSLFGGIIARKSDGVCRNWVAQGDKAAQIMMTLYTLMSHRRRLKIEECLTVWKEKERRNKAKDSPFCIHGHDITKLGANKKGRCSECRRISAREYHYRKMARLGKSVTPLCKIS